MYGYDREKAVAYAHKWAYGRNPAYGDFSEMGAIAPTSSPSVSTRAEPR